VGTCALVLNAIRRRRRLPKPRPVPAGGVHWWGQKKSQTTGMHRKKRRTREAANTRPFAQQYAARQYMSILHEVYSGIGARATVPSHRADYGYQGPPLTCPVRTQWRTLTQDVRKAIRSQQPAPRAVYLPGRPTDSNNPATPAPTISSTQSAPEPGARRAPPNSVHLCSRVERNPTAPPPPQTPTCSGRGSSLVGSEKVTDYGHAQEKTQNTGSSE